MCHSKIYLCINLISAKNYDQNYKNFHGRIIMKRIIKSIKDKLEIDNPNKYKDGYYQLSKKQKRLWISGLFFVGLMFFFIKSPNDKYSLNIVLAGDAIFAFVILAVSFIYSSLCYYPSFYFLHTKKERKEIAEKTTIILYQIWTVCLIIMMSLIIFNINYTYKHIGLLLLTVLFINVINHKKL